MIYLAVNQPRAADYSFAADCADVASDVFRQQALLLATAAHLLLFRVQKLPHASASISFGTLPVRLCHPAL
jgi:hypothetical protein